MLQNRLHFVDPFVDLSLDLVELEVTQFLLFQMLINHGSELAVVILKTQKKISK